MADRDLQIINSSGELTEIYLGGVSAGNKVPITSDLSTLTAAEAQADSTATSVGALKRDFNDLLAKLRAAGLMET